ncbi:MAG: OmpH family outer membrane protein [Bacteroidales bacterium]|jgi:outer membrane protein|nr:OmpH family outer membrane protein [Bacteroidales bacterium]
MKKRTVILILLMTCLLATSFAQNKAKFGHIDYASIIRLIPGVDTAQTVLEKYQKELQSEGELMAAEFRKKNAEYEAFATNPSTSPAVLKLKRDELEKQYKKIEDFSDYMQEEIQQKQLELLKPFQELLINAIEKVAKEGNYIYIFDSATLLNYEKGDDISLKVKEVIGIKP